MDMEEKVVISASATLLIETLEKRWKTYRGELKRCHKEPSEEAIHDLRSATRRLLTLVDMLRELSPHPRLHKLHQMRHLGLAVAAFPSYQDECVDFSVK